MIEIWCISKEEYASSEHQTTIKCSMMAGKEDFGYSRLSPKWIWIGLSRIGIIYGRKRCISIKIRKNGISSPMKSKCFENTKNHSLSMILGPVGSLLASITK